MTLGADSLEPVLLSAIEHYAYCPRQCGLIHVEGVFADNGHTLRGEHEHENVDRSHIAVRDSSRYAFAMPLWSTVYGLVGRADVVEFPEGKPPRPIEYKHGSRAMRVAHDLQLCAQAFCLEEMYGCTIEMGEVFYHGSRRSRVVEFTARLRAMAEATIKAIRELTASGVLPPPLNDGRCTECSLYDLCQPELVSAAASALRGEVQP